MSNQSVIDPGLTAQEKEEEAYFKSENLEINRSIKKMTVVMTWCTGIVTLATII